MGGYDRQTMVNASRKMYFSLFGLPEGWKDRARKSSASSRHLATSLGAWVEFSKRKRLCLEPLACRQISILRAGKEILELGYDKGKSKRGEYQQPAWLNYNPAGSLPCAKRRILFCPQHRHVENYPTTIGAILIFFRIFQNTFILNNTNTCNDVTYMLYTQHTSSRYLLCPKRKKS